VRFNLEQIRNKGENLLNERRIVIHFRQFIYKKTKMQAIEEKIINISASKPEEY